MRLNPIQIQSFKGYDACPIKNIYMQGICNNGHARVFNELKEKCKQEGINLFIFNNPDFSTEFNGVYTQDQHPWSQDDKSFVKTADGTKVFIECSEELKQTIALNNFLDGLGYQKTHNKSFLTGGNSYIGKKPNGENWILIGKDELRKNEIEQICKEYDVKIENIYPISQPNFHIDMSIRPIGYPFILVNDEKIAHQNAKKQSSKLNFETNRFYDELYSHDLFAPKYTHSDETIKELRNFGFVPIKIGGVYTRGINYMNAIVNEHPDGTISYITNSTKNSEFEGLDDVFEQELRQKVPNIRDVYFISGGKSEYSPNFSAIMDVLHRRGGGIHCLTLEEPNFEAWG